MVNVKIALLRAITSSQVNSNHSLKKDIEISLSQMHTIVCMFVYNVDKGILFHVLVHAPFSSRL